MHSCSGTLTKRSQKCTRGSAWRGAVTAGGRDVGLREGGRLAAGGHDGRDREAESSTRSAELAAVERRRRTRSCCHPTTPLMALLSLIPRLSLRQTTRFTYREAAVRMAHPCDAFSGRSFSSPWAQSDSLESLPTRAGRRFSSSGRCAQFVYDQDARRVVTGRLQAR